MSGEFSKSIEKFVRTSGERANVAVRKITLAVAENVVLATPVDKGRARANWQVGISSPPSGSSTETDKGGTSTVKKAEETLEQMKVGDTAYIANNLPYIRALEWGHSQQAPQGMVRKTLASIDAIVGDAVKAATEDSK